MVNVHEDYDSRRQLFQIYAYDYNDPSTDNVTCDIVNPDSTLIELVHDGSHAYDGMYRENMFLYNSELRNEL